jgi:hypothetical protein
MDWRVQMLRMRADGDMSGGTGSSTGSSSPANKKGKSSLLEKNPDDVSTMQPQTVTIRGSNSFANNYPRSL